MLIAIAFKATEESEGIRSNFGLAGLATEKSESLSVYQV